MKSLRARMKKKGGSAMKRRKHLRMALLAVFFVSAALLLLQLRDNAGGSQSYDTALAIATSGVSAKKETAPPEKEAAEEEEQWVPEKVTGDEQMEAMAAIDIAALQEVNPDVIGWIRIPGTKVDYPLLQGQDNDYYLKHTWDGKENSVGSIFMEHRNSPELTDFNTIVYGHNMNDGSMFANIRRYATDWYRQRHPYVYIAGPAGVYRYEVFSSYQAAVDSPAYGLSFHQDKTRADFLGTAIRDSQADFGIRPELTDRVLTLSTCSGVGYSHRWVLHARLKMVKAE